MDVFNDCIAGDTNSSCAGISEDAPYVDCVRIEVMDIKQFVFVKILDDKSAEVWSFDADATSSLQLTVFDFGQKYSLSIVNLRSKRESTIRCDGSLYERRAIIDPNNVDFLTDRDCADIRTKENECSIVIFWFTAIETRIGRREEFRRA